MESRTLAIGAIVGSLMFALGLYFTGGSSSDTKSPENSAKSTVSTASASQKKKATSEPANKYPAGDMTIFFGSQTGTAEGFSRVIMEEAKAKGFNAKMFDLEEFEPDLLASTRLAIFLMATYGEGEPTDNAAKFYKWLKNDSGDVAPGFLSSVKFSVFGLGNKQYEHFNKMGKAVNQLMEVHGATRVFEYGEGDDDTALEEDFEAWKGKMLSSMMAQFHPDGAGSEGPKDDPNTKRVELQFTTETCYEDSVSRTLLTNVGRKRLPSDSFEGHKLNNSTKHFFTASAVVVAVNRELRSESGRKLGSTRHIELDISHTALGTYETAENLAMLPHNNADSVAALAGALGYDLEEVFRLVPVNGAEFRPPFPTPCSVGEALTMYYDINGAPRQATVHRLLAYVTDSKQKAWLENIVSKEQRHAFNDYLHTNGVSIVSLLTNELSSCRIPLEDFLNLIPFIQPRFYTISSSSVVYPGHIHATVSVTQDVKPNGKVINGLCSTYMASLQPGSHCRVFLRASSFKLPEDISKPIIMIGPGTGIAPMRALLQERGAQRAQASAVTTCGSNVLYFGCRRSDEDFIYSDELRDYEASGVLDALHLAFSREGSKKVYVQNLMRQPENAAAILRDIELGGYIYVCGATAMGSDVHAALIDIWSSGKGVSKDAATAAIKNLQDTGRYVQELWSV